MGEKREALTRIPLGTIGVIVVELWGYMRGKGYQHGFTGKNLVFGPGKNNFPFFRVTEGLKLVLLHP